jgi:hypothetical protein
VDEADEVMAEVRRRDGVRFDLELAGGMFAGRALVLRNQADLAEEKSKNLAGAP